MQTLSSRLSRVGAIKMMALLLLVAAAAPVVGNNLPFVTVWKTDNPGTSNSTSITIPTSGSGYSYDVDWNNDGIYDDLDVTESITHDYSYAGIKTVRIRGTFPQIKFGGGGDAKKLIKILFWGDIKWRSMESAFAGCSNMFLLAVDRPDLSEATSLRHMFQDCQKLNTYIGHWQTGTITDMSGMFSGATSFNQSLDRWDVSHVSNFSGMFSEAHSFDQDLKSWDTGEGRTMEQMFAFASTFNGDIGYWNTENVVTMSAMFRAARQFDQSLKKWDVSSVTDMSRMFEDASVFDQDLNDWDVSAVTTMERMFYTAKNFDGKVYRWNTGQVTTMNDMFRYTLEFNQKIGDWDTGNVTDLSGMFFSAKAFDQDLSGWDVSKVVKMNGTFAWTTQFDQDLSAWDVSSVKQMSQLFWGSKFDQDLSSWNVGSVTDMTDFIAKGKLSSDKYDQMLIEWSELNLQTNVRLDVGRTTFCAGAEARTKLIAKSGWIITDGGSEDLPPTAVCRNITVYLDAYGQATIQADTLDGGSSDACGQTQLKYTASQTTFDCADIGPVNVEMTVTDTDGNTATCTATVTVEDGPAAIYGMPENIAAVADTEGCTAAITWVEPFTNCRSTLTSTHQSGDLFPVGTTVVSYMANDGSAESIVASFVVTVTNDLAIAGHETIDATCASADDGEARIDISGGQFPYSYDWSTDGTGDFDDAAIATNLPTGESLVTIRDAVGCQVTTRIAIDAKPVTYSNVPDDVDLMTNTDDCRAVVNWTAPTFSCTAGSISSNYESGDTFPVGTTRVIYTYADDAGQEISCSFAVKVQTDLRLVVEEILAPSCFAGDDGEVVVSATGGKAPYSYAWNDSGTGAFDDSGMADGLTAGQYDAWVMDSTGCKASGTVRLSQPTPIVLDAQSVTSEMGGQVVDLEISGGTAPYTQKWSGTGISSSMDAEDVEVTANGIFSVLVTDSQGCAATTEAEVTELSEVCTNMEFDVFPNPTNGAFAVKFERCAYPIPITVYDSFGRSIAVTSSQDLATDLDFNTLSKGLYYLRVDGRYEVITRTVLVK
ncbi:MAG: BspA family leucine-rich repeat surface protein [Lewinella sp.]